MSKFLVFIGMQDYGKPGQDDFKPLSCHLYEYLDDWYDAVTALFKPLLRFKRDDCPPCREQAAAALRMLIELEPGAGFEDEIDGCSYKLIPIAEEVTS